MKFGCCASLDQIKEVQDAGFDYIELPVSVVKPESPDAEFARVRDMVQEMEIVPEAWNGLLAPDMKVVGPEVDLYRVERYIRTAFQRIEELGGEIVVFGSGLARSFPDGFTADEANDQLVEFLTICGQIAGTSGITIAVEPQNKQQTNTINTLAEGLALVNAVDHPFVKLLVDLHHSSLESEPMTNIIDAGSELVHVHLADSNGLYPGSGSYPCREFFEAINKIGYEDRVSIECSWNDFAIESIKALEFMRELATSN